MTQALANRMTTNPSEAFVSCSALSINHEGLDKHTMTEISGGNLLVIGVLVGVAVVVVTYPEESVEFANWYGDRVSEGYDAVCEIISNW